MFHFYLTFSDGAKYADIARSVIQGSGYSSSFNFWGANNAQAILPGMPLSIAVFFKIFGVNDLAVVAASAFYFLLSLIFVFLLAKKVFNNNLVAFLSSLSVGFNYDFINYATSGASESPFIFEIVAAFYFMTLKRKWATVVGFVLLVLMYFTRPQAIIYIFGLLLYFCLTNFSLKKAVTYFLIAFIPISLLYFLYSKQGIFAVTQVLPGTPVSDSLRGATVTTVFIDLIKKVFYNLYNFYKLMPQILNPYLFGFFIIGIFRWSKNKIYNSFKFTSLFMVALTFLVAALTIPFFRYIHPVTPLIYIVAIATIVEIISLKFPKKSSVVVISSFLILFFVVGQTLGVIFLDSRFKADMVNKDKPPVYVTLSRILRENTNENDIVVTNLDTWGSWYGERKTIWYPLEPDMIISVEDKIDAIYLTSYLMDDENYYMGENWRKIFESPENQTILKNYKFAGEYEFSSEDNYQRQDEKAVLLVRKDEVK